MSDTEPVTVDAGRLAADDLTADGIVCWLAAWARQEGAPEGTADWLDAQSAAKVCGTALTRVLDWPRSDYGTSWAELTGYLAELCKVGRPFDLDDLHYVHGLHRRALQPVADWMEARR